MYWLVLRISIIFASYTLILRKGLKILGSIKSLKIFFSDNIKNFRQIGNYGLIIFLFTSINFFIRSSSSNFSINPHFEILLLAFGSFIISEIFAEGKLLQEEKDQII
jgi:hypothetical protein